MRWVGLVVLVGLGWASQIEAAVQLPTISFRRLTKDQISASISTPGDGTWLIQRTHDWLTWETVTRGDDVPRVAKSIVLRSDQRFGFYRMKFWLKPTFSKELESLEVLAGSKLVFAVDVRSEWPMQFVWEFNGKPIEGATNTTFTLENITTAQGGVYQFGVISGDHYWLARTTYLDVYDFFPPESIAGKFIEVTIKNGTRPFASRGVYGIIVSETGNAYEIVTDGTFRGSEGTYTYERTGKDTAQITFDDSLVGSGASVALTFTSLREGNYVLKAAGGQQVATFFMP